MERNPSLPSVSILSPAYNEEVTIVERLNSLLKVEYPKLEIIVINDGSSDDTLGALKEGFGMVSSTRKYEGKIPTQEVKKVYRSTLHDNLFVLDKDNG